MGYIQAILSVMILVLTIARAFFPGQLFAFLHHYLPLFTRPDLLAFIHRHPRLIHSNPDILPLTNRTPSRPPSLHCSPFGRLAPETIHYIASFLPPSSAASFASTCLPIRLMTGTQYLASLRTCPYEMVSFLSSLALDLNTPPTSTLPSRLFCLYCRRLVPYPSLCGPTASPFCREGSTSYHFYGPSSFHHQIFHTAMLLYRRGYDPYPLLNHLKPRSAPTTRIDNGTTTQTAWEYSIIRGSLYQRTRCTFIFPRSDDNNTHPLTVQPCPHYASYQRAMNREAELVQDLVREKPKLHACSDMVSCQKCRTVLRVGCRKFRGLGLGLFVTWWVDLGDAYWAVPSREGRSGWKDVKYTRKWLMDYFDHFCSSQRYFDFVGMDTRADRKELLAIARSHRV